MKFFIRLSTVAVICSFLFVGCAAPITSGTGKSAMTQGDYFSKHLEIQNPKLVKKLNIVDVKSRKTKSLLEINLKLQSTYKKSLKLQYHLNWFDAQGYIIASRKIPWKALELHGFQSTALRGLAPNEQVASFTVYVREIPEKAYKY